MVIGDVFISPPSPSPQANPYHYKDKVVIIGDAAHSMVPFYGQGLNCGFEDVRILSSKILAYAVTSSVPSNKTSPSDDQNLALALSAYSDERHDDLVAICELAMRN